MVKLPNTAPRRPTRPASEAESLRLDELWLLEIFHLLLQRYGIERARQMFANYAREPNDTELQEHEKLVTLQRLDNMSPRPNVKQLVRELLAEEGIGPDDKKFPHRSGALDRKIRRWRKDGAAMKAKFGAVSPPLAAGEPAKFVIHGKRTSRKP